MVLWAAAMFLPFRERTIAVILGGASVTGGIFLIATSV
jgi:hypothetical protein